MEQPSNQPQRPVNIVINLPHLSRRHWVIALGGLIVAIALALAGIWYVRENTTAVGIPGSITERYNFPLYFPRRPPAEFTFKDNSFASNANDTVFSYSFMYKDKPIAVTIQPVSDGISTSEFNPTESFMSPIGKAYVADLEYVRTTAAITTDKSFMLINAPGQVPLDAMKQFINSFRPSR